MAEPEEEYVIHIPGVQDIIRLPALDSETVKRERISRWALQSTQSSIPEPLRWLTEVVTWLDDCQDILITALVLAKPLLRRLPSRFIPYLGWALLANDVFNLLTSIFSAPLTPRTKKVHFLQHTRKIVAGRKMVVDTARAFLLPGRIRWIPFALQAGQVLETFTGWGLQLGGVMGAVSETFWGAIRALGGARVKVVVDRTWDPIAKAASVMARSFYLRALTDVANPQEIAIVINALNACASILGAPHIPQLSDERMRLMSEVTVPFFKPWNKETRAALAALGFNPDGEDRVPVPAPFDNMDYGTATALAIAHDPRIDLTLAARLRDTDYDWPFGLQASEYSQWIWDVYADGHGFVVPLNSPMEYMLAMALEYGVMPPFMYWPEDPSIAEDERKFGVNRLPIGVTTVTQPGFWRIDPHMRFRAPYPPPDDDPNVQLAHWAAIALALYCGRKIWLPQYHTTQDGTHQIFNWILNTRTRGKEAIRMAAGLVWGTALARIQFPDPSEPTAPSGEAKFKKYCLPSDTPWPSLSGKLPELRQLAEILEAIPEDAKTLLGDGPWPIEWGEPNGRDWLDNYMRAQDVRRLQYPSNIDPARPPQPQPWDEADVPNPPLE